MANAVMHHHQDVQTQEAGRIRNRRAFQAKLFLILATALFSGFPALAIARSVCLDQFSAMSGPVLVVLSAGLRNRCSSSCPGPVLRLPSSSRELPGAPPSCAA